MPDTLIPLSEIPTRDHIREDEARARRNQPSRTMALDVAKYEIIEAEGTLSFAYPQTYGWVLTIEAAVALAEIVRKIPGSRWHPYDWRLRDIPSSALDTYRANIACGMPREEALALYEAEYEAERGS